jgi:molybdopterin/thiamine biosynthesis adenylyltransferase
MIARFCNNLCLQSSLSSVRRIVDFPSCCHSTLLDSCLESAALTNPQLTLRVSDARPQDCISITIGGNSEVSISSKGWFVYLNWTRSRVDPDDDLNPFGALLASCFGSAEIFRILIRRIGVKGAIAQRRLENIRFSALDYSYNSPVPLNPSLPSSIDVGSVLFVGCGAVTNGAMSVLYQLPALQATFGLVDDETTSYSNVERYVMSYLPDVGKAKPVVLQERFTGKQVSITPLCISVESLPTEMIDQYDIVFSGLDNRNGNQARFVLQNALPYRIVHAATQGLGISVASIGFMEGICLGCLFSPRPGERELVLDSVCGGVILQTPQLPFAASTSFVSATCGILAASELVKLTSPELRGFALNNYLSLSVMSPDLADSQLRVKDPHCLCLCSDKIRHCAFETKHIRKRRIL